MAGRAGSTCSRQSCSAMIAVAMSAKATSGIERLRARTTARGARREEGGERKEERGERGEARCDCGERREEERREERGERRGERRGEGRPTREAVVSDNVGARSQGVRHGLLVHTRQRSVAIRIAHYRFDRRRVEPPIRISCRRRWRAAAAALARRE